MSLLGGIGSVLGGLGGLFNKPKTISSGDNLRSLARAAREVSAETGFNPLTLLQAGAGTSGFSTGGVPPLASVELITGGLDSINDVVSGDVARQRAADQLNLDMAKLRFDQARSGVVTAPLSAADAVGGGLSPLGSRPVQVYAADGQTSGGSNAAFSGGAVPAASSSSSGGKPVVRDVAGNPMTRRYVVNGVVIEADPRNSDGQVHEDRGGEPQGAIGGWNTFFNDVTGHFFGFGYRKGDTVSDGKIYRPEPFTPPRDQSVRGVKPDGIDALGRAYWMRGGQMLFTPPKSEWKN